MNSIYSISRFLRENLFLRLNNLVRSFLDNFGGEESEKEMPLSEIGQMEKARFDSTEEAICPICQCDFVKDEEILILGCKHIFH